MWKTLVGYGFLGNYSAIKVIISGNVIEVYTFEKMPGKLVKKKPGKDEEKDVEWFGFEWTKSSDTGDLLRQIKKRSDNVQRARNTVRRLALMNFTNNDKFVTFTFRENVIDVITANKEWRKFIKRLRRKYGDFKYLSVVEFQKRGAVHYHALMNIPYIKKSEIAEIWGNGFVKINRINHVDNVGAYIVKYMTKELIDNRLFGLKSYNCSRGLKRPVVLRGEDAESFITLHGLENKKKVFTGSYISEYHGLITYSEYNLSF